MAIYENGKIVPGTERKKDAVDVVWRRRDFRAQWKPLIEESRKKYTTIYKNRLVVK